MQVRRHAGDATWKNFAAFGHELFQEIGIFVINRFNRDVDAAARHGAIGATKSGTTFGGFGLHEKLFRLPMERVLSQKGIVFFLFQSIGRARAFFVSLSRVTRNRFAERLCLGAFERNDLLGHGELFLRFLGGRLFLFRLAPFIIG
jgi:hypothetical protein